MLFPSIFNDSFTDGFFDDFFSTPTWDYAPVVKNNRTMNADVKEFDDKYELELEMPGYSKDDISAELKDGYLTVTAEKKDNNDQKDENGKYIRRERFYGSARRSFYVGKDMKEEDIHASFKNGILTLFVPKKQAQPVVENKKLIAIEGE